MYKLPFYSTLFIIYISLFSSFANARTLYDTEELKLVFMVHRHGDRTPSYVFPANPNANASYLSIGLGQLTNRGKDRMFRLGSTIRNRYNTLLGSSPRVVQIRTSNVERCLESVALLMAGMFKPQGSWKWNQNLGQLWQPFPIQTAPQACDGMVNYGAVCQAMDQENQRINNGKDVQDYLLSKKPLLEYLLNKTGMNITQLNIGLTIYDNLFNDKENGLKLPDWVTDDVYEGLRDIANMYYYYSSYTTLIQRFTTGLILKDIVKYMNQTINSPSSSNQKFYIYSTHDIKVAQLLTALNIFDKKGPPYGSTVLIEFIKKDINYVIRVYYLKPTESDKPVEYHLPNCSYIRDECRFTQFVDSITDVLPDDWFRECNNEDQSACLNTIQGSQINI